MARIAETKEHTAPGLLQALGECAAFMDLARQALSPERRPRRRRVQQAVLVVPGFGTNDTATALLRRHLRDAGFRVYAWKQGVNRGPGGTVMRRLARRVRALAAHSTRPVHIVGWSLGGLMGRVIAGRLPHLVDRVIALGSPLTADPKSSHLSALYDVIAHRPISPRTLRRMLRESAAAPVVSIYARHDGVVARSACVDAPGDCRLREVDSTHLGMMVDPAVHEVVVKELARAG